MRVSIEKTRTTPRGRPSGQDYLDRFGNVGGRWFAEGLPWDECVMKHQQGLRDRVAQLQAENDQLRKRLESMQPEAFELSQGQGGPMTFAQARTAAGIAPGQAGTVRIPMGAAWSHETLGSSRLGPGLSVTILAHGSDKPAAAKPKIDTSVRIAGPKQPGLGKNPKFKPRSERGAK